MYTKYIHLFTVPHFSHFLCKLYKQQNYIVKTDMNGSVLLCEKFVLMSVWVVVIPSGITMTIMDIKTGFHG